MTKLFRNDSPGALTLEQARALEIKRLRERRRQAEELAALGRGEDTEIAHVARGEIVVPEALQTPEVIDAVRRAAADSGIPFAQLCVGSVHNNINPNTGVAEFLLDGLGSRLNSAVDAVSQVFGERPSDRATHLAPGPTDPRFQNRAPAYISPTDGIGTARLPLEPRRGTGHDAPGFGAVTGPEGKTYRMPPQAQAWPTVHGDAVTGKYGPRPTFGDSHSGLDFRNKLNEPVLSAVDGEVRYIGPDPKGRAGTYIQVADQYGNLHGYAHSGLAEGVAIGTPVSAGQRIGFSNGTGRTPDNEPIEPHLHNTFRQGTLEYPATMQTPYSDPNLIYYGLRAKR